MPVARSVRITVLALAGAMLVSLGGCGGDDSGGGPADVCEGIDCSGHGVCVATAEGEALCLCDPGYRSEGTECLAYEPGEECSGVTCSGHGTCVVIRGEPDYPLCLCDDGYRRSGDTDCVPDDGGLECGPGTHEEGGRCLPDELPPGSCDGVDCGANGVCRVNAFGRAYCECDEGYRSENLTCVEENCATVLELVAEMELPLEEGEANTYQRGPRLFLRGDFAYVPVMHGLAVVDVSDPSSPSLVADAFSPWGREPRHLTLDAAMGGDHVYLAQSWEDEAPNSTCGVAVFDVSDPAAPVVVGQVEKSDVPGMQCLRLALVGDTLVSGRHHAGLTSLDVSDPAQPVVKQVLDLDSGDLPSYSEMYPLGTDWVWITTLVPDMPNRLEPFPPGPWGMLDVRRPEAMEAHAPMLDFRSYSALGVSGTLAAAGAEHGAFYLMDLSTPTEPLFLGGTTVPARLLYEARFFGHYAVLSADTGVYVLDVADPAAPRVVASLDASSGGAIRHGLAVREDGLIVGRRWPIRGFVVLRFRCQ